MYRTHNKLSTTQRLAYKPLDHLAFASHTLTLYRPLVPQSAHPLISAAALFVSRLAPARRVPRRNSNNPADPLPLALRLKTPTRRL